jgi:hypothetical protein
MKVLVDGEEEMELELPAVVDEDAAAAAAVGVESFTVTSIPLGKLALASLLSREFDRVDKVWPPIFEEKCLS